MRNKTTIIFGMIIVLVLVLVLGVLIFFKLDLLKMNFSKNNFKYKIGFFIGADKLSVDKFSEYETVVIDVTNYSKNDIERFHKEGHKVYAYLNIGSLEEYRKYYKQFSDLSLGTYPNWDDEVKIDVTSKRWQNYVVNVLGKQISQKNVDDYFIDNTDLYYYMKDEANANDIYKGLLKIIDGLNKYKPKLIINGGDYFVQRLLKENKVNLIAGVNQESVFTTYNVGDDGKLIYKNQAKDDVDYYVEYFEKCRKKKLSVSLIEYTKDKDKIREVKNFCKKNNYMYFITDSNKLNKI
ncbi:endo alpha-1,4 polygalactosaminidase [Lachnobacterium bovis]|uniref:endo alpha-1,4 polygalactosaminidase n=1 Tax=Lachnobacterium bovis TaxID=140626 RepID=UPI0003B6BC95|nr:endo alpha-1,4 polygalactosaminidase [Lachnobacterium bovis]